MSPKALKILQFTTNFKQGGIQRHILDLTSHLRRSGHRVVLAGAPNVWGNENIDDDFEAVPLDQVSSTGSSMFGRVKAAHKSSRRLREIINEYEIDLIHSHETAPAIVAKVATIGTKLPKIITYHGSAPTRVKQFARVSRFCADVAVSPSQTTLNQLVDFGVPRARTKVLGLGISQKPNSSESEIAEIRASLNLKADDMLCLSLSRLDYQKGIDIMIDVAGKVISKNPRVTFAVGGTGPLADEVEGWLKKAGIEDRFKFLGSVSDVQNYLAAADFYLLTSRWEALPISIVEAFRAGLPVIATDCGGVKELVDDQVGRLCEVGNVDQITRAILDIAEDSALRNDMSLAALEKSRSSRFDPQSVHEAFEQLYLELANKS